MLKLKDIIHQLNNNEYKELTGELKNTQGEKLTQLLTFYRESKVSDARIMQKLNISENAFYTLKSRLYSKVQSFHLKKMTSSGANRNDRMETLLFETPRYTAIAILKKMAEEYQEKDMPYELAGVYKTLKQLHVYSPKYYEYTQLYNKHLAHTFALDKADELLVNFHVQMGDYFLSHNSSLKELLYHINMEMANVCKLYDSHHLQVYHNIMRLSLLLFIENNAIEPIEEPIEDILQESYHILETHPGDHKYKYLKKVFYFFSSQYYTKIGQHKKAKLYFDAIYDDIPGFLLYNFCCFNSRFFITIIQRSRALGTEAQMHEHAAKLRLKYQPDMNDLPVYIAFYKYLIAAAYYAGKYDEMTKLVNTVLEEAPFRTKEMLHTELEFKLLYMLMLCMTKKYDEAKTMERSIYRKLRELKKENVYSLEPVEAFLKFLYLQLHTDRRQSAGAILSAFDLFTLINKGEHALFDFIELTEGFIRKAMKLSKYATVSKS